VVILATVRLGARGLAVRLADVHLENRSGWLLPNHRATGIGRRDQMRALLRAVQLDGPTVLAGDLNTWAYGTAEPVVGDLVGSQRFTFTPLPEGDPTLVAFFGLYARQLDYVFFRLPDGWSGDSHRVASRYGSDHYPLLAWVRPAATTLAAAGSQ
jgi:endonuclease/exonuclease/phosphatase (EEP) superfamily protein YafD